jgi:hypothetical protein
MMMMMMVVVVVVVVGTSFLDSFDVLHEESQFLGYLCPGLQGQGVYQEHEPLDSVQLLQDH